MRRGCRESTYTGMDIAAMSVTEVSNNHDNQATDESRYCRHRWVTQLSLRADIDLRNPHHS